MSGKPLQNEMKIRELDVKTAVRKMPKWNSSGPDLVQGFWFKKLTGLHTRLKSQVQDCLNQGNVAEWVVRGRTVLVMEDPQKETEIIYYCPIACLPIDGNDSREILCALCSELSSG